MILVEAIGKTWIEVCERMLERDTDSGPMDTGVMRELFLAEFKKRFHVNNAA